MDFRGIFVWLLRSIAGYVTKQTGEYNRKDTQDGRYKKTSMNDECPHIDK